MNELDPLAHPLTGTSLIEASAGTGKTFTITTLFLRLLLEKNLRVGEILVVTYTNAATAELRTRLRARLDLALSEIERTRSGGDGRGAEAAGDDVLAELVRRRARAGLLDDDRRRLSAALYAFDDASVFTIHGFCQRILQEHAFESGVLFDARLVTDQRSLVREIVRDFWVRRLHDAPPGFVRFLKGKWNCLEDLTGLALRAVALPDVPVLPQLPPPPAEMTDDDRFLRLRLDLVHEAREELRRRKEEENIQYFDDLLTRLRDGLERPGGHRLAEKIRQRYRAALIDEFQDTDPIQYQIFHRVYGEGDAPLFLIGDPKQAIYAFRGADVFTYVDAKRHVAPGGEGTLGVNRRSDPRLIAAVNALFGEARHPFVIDGIPFLSAEAGPDAEDHLGGALAGSAPLQFLYLRKGGGKQPIEKGVARDRIYRDVAGHVARLLASGGTLKGEAIRPNHIAVLCRRNVEARAIQAELRRLRIPSVLQTDESVLETSEADEMKRLLAALAEPTDSAAIVAALATATLGVAAEEIRRMREQNAGWDLWAERFHRCHGLWLETGFMPAFRCLLEESGVLARVLADVDGERRMTNLLHLAEILHNGAVEGHRGPLALAEWFGEICTNPQARADALGDAAQIRLESDDLALKLATIHRSKGLEYPIVYCPFLWDGELLRGRDKNELCFHDPEHGLRLTLAIAQPAAPAHKARAEHESLAENLRLLYVALTRARHLCVVVWGPVKSAKTSALGYVLHQQPELPGADAAALADATCKRIHAMSDADMLADLEALRARAQGAVEITELSAEAGPPYRPAEGEAAAPVCSTFTRSLSLRWRTASFSSLISGSTPISREAEEGLDRDESDENDAALPPVPLPGAAVTLADFPAGTRAGQLLHSIFENLEFDATADAIDTVVAAQLAAFGFDAELRQPLAQAMPEILRTPLDGKPDPLRLAHIGSRSRLNELEFLFPVLDPAARQAPGVTSGDLGTALQRHAQGAVRPYAERLRHLGFVPLSGYLKGYVDLVFVHGGRWYVVDYKSNHLGALPQHYEPARLFAAMAQHHYFLQYHLYAVALHRHLRARLRGYDYEEHFGGVYYLFLRGMAPQHRLGNGVFFDRPSHALIAELSALLEGGAR